MIDIFYGIGYLLGTLTGLYFLYLIGKAIYNAIAGIGEDQYLKDHPIEPKVKK